MEGLQGYVRQFGDMGLGILPPRMENRMETIMEAGPCDWATNIQAVHDLFRGTLWGEP